MKRDDMYFAREDVAFNAWLRPRRHLLDEAAFLVEATRDLVRSAFLSGARFGSEEAEIQAVTCETKAQQESSSANSASASHKAGSSR